MYKLTDRSFFSQDALALAKALLGKLIVHEVDGAHLALRITETEAYLGVDDLASHSAGGRLTRRNRIMFGKPGHVYMFLIYGRYFCFNITANDEGRPEAVLIRAGEPVLGAPVMLENRGLNLKGGSAAAKERSIADGPGKLCMALGLNMEHYGLDLADEEPTRLFIAQDDFKPKQSEIISDVRIGIDYAGAYRDRPWRFYLKERTVSLTKEKRLQRQMKNV